MTRLLRGARLRLSSAVLGRVLALTALVAATTSTTLAEAGSIICGDRRGASCTIEHEPIPPLIDQPFTFDFEDGLQGWELGGSAARVETQILGGNWALFADGASAEGAWISQSFDIPETLEIRVDQFCVGFGGGGCSFLVALHGITVIDAVFVGELSVFELLDRSQNPGISRVVEVEPVFSEAAPLRITIYWGGPLWPQVEGAVGFIDNITLVPIPEPSTLLLVLGGLAAAGVMGRRSQDERLREWSGRR